MARPSSLTMQPHPPRALVAVGALFPGVLRGITADALAASALGRPALSVCTAIAIAGHGTVTDFVEVPEDTVRAQLGHVLEQDSIAGLKIGVLAGFGAVRAVFHAAEAFDGPVVLDFQLSGPDGETLVDARGIEEVRGRLGVPNIVLLSRKDAELISRGEITSLDDAQVAAQRIVRAGARRVLIKCGVLPARHFDVQGDGGIDDGTFATDIFYDGNDFALLEAPLLPSPPGGGPASAHSVAVADALINGADALTALQQAKRFVTEAIRRANPTSAHEGIDYFWEVQAH